MEIYKIGLPSRDWLIAKGDSIISRMPEEQRVMYGQYVETKGGRRNLLGNLLVRNVISNKMRIKCHAIDIVRDKYGKPFHCNAPSNMPRVNFNVSHSGQWIVCAFSDCPVGVDVQRIRPIDCDIARRIYSKEEYQKLQSKSREEKLSYFYELWTFKESYIKAVGMGLSIPLNSFTVEIENNTATIKNNNDLHLRQYELGEEYKMAVCGYDHNIPDVVLSIGIDEVISKDAALH
jgi:4'-phosphopantetheinyl transferase